MKPGKKEESEIIFLDNNGSVDEFKGDRRNHVRFPVALAVRYKDLEPRIYNDLVLNASRGGVYISTEAPFQVGTALDMHFYIPPSEKLLGEFRGEVVGINLSGGSYPTGMNVKFIDCDEDALNSLVEYLEGRKLLVDEEA
ncbi:MAG: PilZ domain-containing protein [Deltaproteobacteria bacterium]